jgi:hypothetical protein
MANSYRKIDYRLRPAKTVERRMIAEYFLRLRGFGTVEDYRYVGLGSVYFSDFALFNIVCGFRDMVSIELTEDPTIKKRFEFNAPLGSIDIQFGHTSTVLPKLDWSQKVAAWMDYDGTLESYVLTDLGYMAATVASESIVLMSVNGELADNDEGNLSKLEVLSSRVGRAKLPARFQGGGSLPSKIVPALYREILTNEIQEALTKRNAGKEDKAEWMNAEQVMFFKYSDGVEMLTLGWVFFLEKDKERFMRCGFSELSHARNSTATFDIEIPFMTNAEIRELNRCKVSNGNVQAKHIPVPPSEIAKYMALKRFWPVLQIPEMT